MVDSWSSCNSCSAIFASPRRRWLGSRLVIQCASWVALCDRTLWTFDESLLLVWYTASRRTTRDETHESLIHADFLKLQAIHFGSLTREKSEKSNLVLEVYWFKRHKFSFDLGLRIAIMTVGICAKRKELDCAKVWLFMNQKMSRFSLPPGVFWEQFRRSQNSQEKTLTAINEWNMTNTFSRSIKCQSRPVDRDALQCRKQIEFSSR